MTEPAIPQRRRAAKSHMAAAAKTSLGSTEEYYSVQAAQAEALMDLVEATQSLTRQFAVLADAIMLSNKVMVALFEKLQAEAA